MVNFFFFFFLAERSSSEKLSGQNCHIVVPSCQSGCEMKSLNFLDSRWQGRDAEVGIGSQPRSLPCDGSKFESHKFYEPWEFETHNSFCIFVMAGIKNVVPPPQAQAFEYLVLSWRCSLGHGLSGGSTSLGVSGL